MADLPVYIENAAFEAHMSAAEFIAAALGTERAGPGDVARALAHAYGEALGIYAMTGASNDELTALGKAASDASSAMVTKVHMQSCEGSA